MCLLDQKVEAAPVISFHRSCQINDVVVVGKYSCKKSSGVGSGWSTAFVAPLCFPLCFLCFRLEAVGPPTLSMIAGLKKKAIVNKCH